MNSDIDIKVPGYRLEKLLGRGGMTTVYLATQTSLGRPVALKILTDPETPQFFERFFNEGRYLARLSHNNLVSIYDIGQGDGFYYIAMEYLPGGDLKSRLSEGIRPKTALKLLAQLAACLGYVHSQGLVHRDIKPSNILFREDSTPVLTDFGIAKLVQADNDLTVTGTVMGSPHYLSPELAQGSRELDGRSDIYSLGVLLYQMLTGEKPYTSDSYAATLMAHIQNPIPTLPEKFSQYQALLEKLMAKNPDERLQTGGEVIKAIQELQAESHRKHKKDQAAKTKPSEDGHSPGFKSRRILVAMALLAGVALGVWLLIPGEEEPANDTPSATSPDKATDDADQPKDLFATVKPESTISITAEEEPEDADIASSETPPDAATTSLLEMADKRLAEDKLSLPAGDSARDYYRQALERDPGNERARSGLTEIADRYARFARQSLRNNRMMKAERHITQGLATQPDHAGLKKLRREIETGSWYQAPPAAEADRIFDQLPGD
ncbi:MAG: protein kinase [Sedimenticola sp.]